MKITERLFSEKPKFHNFKDGTLTSWALSKDCIGWLEDNLQPDWRSLETGSGYSSVVFAAKGCIHSVITPSENESARLKEYINKLFPEHRVTFIVEPSQYALPKLRNEQIDFALIDGAHRYPMACTDFCYIQSMLKVGGIVGVDDFPMPSVGVLYDFLMLETSNWKLKDTVDKTAFFEKLSEPNLAGDWQNQVMNQAYKQAFLEKKEPLKAGPNRSLMARVKKRLLG